MGWLVGLVVSWLSRTMRRDAHVAATVETIFWVLCLLLTVIIAVALLLSPARP